MEFVKPRGKDPKPNDPVNVEEFIAVKGIKAQGNQLTTDKLKHVNVLEALPYEVEEEIAEVEENSNDAISEDNTKIDTNNDESDQTTLF